MKRMAVDDHLDIGANAQNLGMDRPLAMAASASGNLLSVPIEQHEVVRAYHFTKPNTIALHPETPSFRIPQREMAERHVTVAFQLQDPACPRGFSQRGVQSR
jgi:hypothetical protein